MSEDSGEYPIIFSDEMVLAILDGRKTQTRRLVRPPSGKLLRLAELGDGRLWPHSGAAGSGLRWEPMRCPYGSVTAVGWTTFREASPPGNGWYEVRWPGVGSEFAQLTRVADGPHERSASDVERWVWKTHEGDDPESVALDVEHPLEIAWRRLGDELWVREAWAPDPREESHYDSKRKASAGIYYRADFAYWERGALLRGEPWEGRSTRMPPERWRPSIHMPQWASRLYLELTAVRAERLREITEADAVSEGVELYGERGHGHASAVRAYGELWERIHGPGTWDEDPAVWVLEFRRAGAAVSDGSGE